LAWPKAGRTQCDTWPQTKYVSRKLYYDKGFWKDLSLRISIIWTKNKQKQELSISQFDHIRRNGNKERIQGSDAKT
jgi:hypothetical protein